VISSRTDGYTVGPIRRAMLLVAGSSSIALGVLTIVGAMEIEAWPPRLLFATFWFSLGLLACIDLRPKVALRPEGVRVVNRLKTVVVPWNEFERFVPQRAYLRQYMGHVETRDGRTIPVQILVTRGELGGLDSRLEGMVARLNEMAGSDRSASREWSPSCYLGAGMTGRHACPREPSSRAAMNLSRVTRRHASAYSRIRACGSPERRARP